MRKIIMTRTYETEYIFFVDTDEEAIALFMAMDDEEKYGEEAEQMCVTEENHYILRDNKLTEI